jgi:hypothetical protein
MTAAGYGGPYPIEKVSIAYSGFTDLSKYPPVGAAANLPKEAGPNYQHIAFVELDRCVKVTCYKCMPYRWTLLARLAVHLNV